MHDSVIRALSRHGPPPSPACKAPSRQAERHSPQNVQPPRPKSIAGNPPAPTVRTASGQAATHSPQPVQHSMKSGSTTAHGGRCGALLPERSPRRNCMRLIALRSLLSPFIGAGVCVVANPLDLMVINSERAPASCDYPCYPHGGIEPIGRISLICKPLRGVGGIEVRCRQRGHGRWWYNQIPRRLSRTTGAPRPRNYGGIGISE